MLPVSLRVRFISAWRFGSFSLISTVHLSVAVIDSNGKSLIQLTGVGLGSVKPLPRADIR